MLSVDDWAVLSLSTSTFRSPSTQMRKTPAVGWNLTYCSMAYHRSVWERVSIGGVFRF